MSISSSTDSTQTVEDQEPEMSQPRLSQSYRDPPPSYNELMFDRPSNKTSATRQDSSPDVYVTHRNNESVEIGR